MPEEKTILVVDDEKPERQILFDTLTEEGFNVIEAENGEEGLESALANHPDLILLDILMPKMDGISMLNRLRTDPWGQDVPVLLLTNLSDFDKFTQAVESGVKDYMIKSDWKIEEVIDKVKKKLGMGGVEAEDTTFDEPSSF